MVVLIIPPCPRCSAVLARRYRTNILVRLAFPILAFLAFISVGGQTRSLHRTHP